MPFKNQPPLYNTWLSMKGRCLNPNSQAWKHYGGRGISVCDEWLNFRTFERDMGEKPTPKHSLDRIDPNGNYEPSNCRWATSTEQARNTRTTRWVTIEGVRYRAADLAEISGKKGDTIIERAERGLTLSEVISPEKYQTDRHPVEAIAARVKKQMSRTHCTKGHELTEENTIRPGENQRLCRTCYNARKRKSAKERRARKLVKL